MPHNIEAERIAFLRKRLGFGESASIRAESALGDEYPIQLDLIIEDGEKTYAIEIKRIVRMEGLSGLALLKLLVNSDTSSTQEIELVIAGKRITADAARAAEKIGIRFIKLPADMFLGRSPDTPSSASVKLTFPKSWEVISHLLKVKKASIRQLSIGSGVSYGWTHATVQALLSKGIASNSRGQIVIADINKLLNGIAWERPFERLFAEEIRVIAKDPIALAEEISLVCDELRIPCAFSSYTAGEIYTGYSARHDAAYLYLEKKYVPELSGMLDVGTKEDISARIYHPDRDLFKDRRISSVKGVWLVSPAQALLDCAGLGYPGRDLTQKLVAVYDRV